MRKRELATVRRQNGKPNPAFGDDVEVGAGIASRENNLARLIGRFPHLRRNGLAARLIEAAEKGRSSKEIGGVCPQSHCRHQIHRSLSYSCPVSRSAATRAGLAKGPNLAPLFSRLSTLHLIRAAS